MGQILTMKPHNQYNVFWEVISDLNVHIPHISHLELSFTQCECQHVLTLTLMLHANLYKCKPVFPRHTLKLEFVIYFFWEGEVLP